MSSRRRAQDYAESILARPRSDYAITLRSGRTGVSLLHRGRVLTRCHNSRVGTLQAIYMAEALGVAVPVVGSVANAVVPSGVLYRALAISGLNLRLPEARQVLARLLEVARIQRGLTGTSA